MSRYNINYYAARSGRVIKEDGTYVNVADGYNDDGSQNARIIYGPDGQPLSESNPLPVQLSGSKAVVLDGEYDLNSAPSAHPYLAIKNGVVALYRLEESCLPLDISEIKNVHVRIENQARDENGDLIPINIHQTGFGVTVKNDKLTQHGGRGADGAGANYSYPLLSEHLLVPAGATLTLTKGDYEYFNEPFQGLFMRILGFSTGLVLPEGLESKMSVTIWGERI